MRLARRRAADVRGAGDRREPGEVDPVVTGDEAQDRLAAGSGRDDEDERLDDLPEFDAERRGRLGGGVGRLVELDDLERHALAGGGIEDALDRGMDGGVGHGRSLASGHAARRPRSGSIAAMVALILADGDVPARSDLDRAWPGWDAAVEVVIAADGGARHAAALGVAIDLWVGDGDSIGEDALAALEAAGVPLERSPQDKDESDTELAIRAALRLGQRRRPHPRRAGRPDRPCPRQHRPPRDARAGRSRGRHPRRAVADRAHPRARSGWRRRRAPAAGPARRPRVAPAARRRRRGRDDARPGLPARRTSRSPSGAPAGCRTSARRPMRRSPSGAACCSSWSRLLGFEP